MNIMRVIGLLMVSKSHNNITEEIAVVISEKNQTTTNVLTKLQDCKHDSLSATIADQAKHTQQLPSNRQTK